MQTTNASEVKYRESDREYSFHNWPNNSCEPARVLWLSTKYPSKNIWMKPAVHVFISGHPSLFLMIESGITYSNTSKQKRPDPLDSLSAVHGE